MFVLNIPAGDKPLHRVPEKPRILPIVKPPFKLFQVGLQMLLAQLVVGAHDSLERKGIGPRHGLANTVAEIPRGFVAHADGALKLGRADALFALDHQVGRDKPFAQRQVGIVEDRPTRNREAIAALVAVVLVAGRDLGHAFTGAARALYSLRPADFFKVAARFILVGEAVDQLNQVHFLLCHDHS